MEIVPILLNPERNEKLLKPTIEVTGNGELLCYEAFGGRWFRSSEEAVRKAAEKFIDLYAQGNYLSWNDLYILLGISPSQFGNHYGYSGDEEYRNCTEIEFNIVLLDEEDNYESMGESVLIIELATEYCLPYDYYMEV